MYTMQWGKKTPGYLVFLIDQSGSMECLNKHLQVANAVQKAIWECMLGCISGVEVRNRFRVLVIGYSDNAEIKSENWIGDNDLLSKLKEAHSNGSSFIKAEADGVTAMADGFKLAKSKIESWINSCQQQVEKGTINGIPAPIVVNITDGEPCEYGSSNADAIKNATVAAKELTSLYTADGNVLLFNLHLSDTPDKTIYFPKERGDLDGSSEATFLYNISSELDDNMVHVAKISGLEFARRGSKGMIVNASGDTITKFIQFGSGVSGVVSK